jgi:hypothetical protein
MTDAAPAKTDAAAAPAFIVMPCVAAYPTDQKLCEKGVSTEYLA